MNQINNNERSTCDMMSILLLIIAGFSSYVMALNTTRPYVPNLKKIQEADIILHIGPPKTATSHIQHTLIRLRGDLDKLGFCYPSDEQSLVHRIGKHLRAGHRQDPDNDTIHECLKKGHRVIISSEKFAQTYLSEGFLVIKKFFSGYKVHIVVSFRDPLTMAYSWYNQIMKKSDHSWTFSDYMGVRYNSLASRVLSRALFNYQREFGIDNMTVIDFNGMLAAKKDPSYVFLCELIGILCNAQYIAEEGNNPSQDLRPSYLYSFVRNFAYSLGCRFTSSEPFKQLLEDNENLNFQSLPMMYTSVEVMRHLAKNIDEEVRHTFNKVMVYSNPAAAETARNKFSVEEVDEEEFCHNREWTKWLWGEIARLKADRQLVECRNILDLSKLV